MRARFGKSMAALLMLVVFAMLIVLLIMPGCVIGTLLWLLTGNERIYRWVKKAGKALDQTCNCLLPNGHPKETISSHVGRLILAEREHQGPPAPWWARALNWVLDKFDDNHAIDAIEAPFKEMPLN